MQIAYEINIDEMSTEFHTVLLFMKEVKKKKVPRWGH